MPQLEKPPGFWESLAANLGRPGQVQGFNVMSPFYGLTREGKAAGLANIAEQTAAGDKARGYSAVAPSAQGAAVAQNQLGQAQSESSMRQLPGQEALAGQKQKLDQETMSQVMKWAADHKDSNPLAANYMQMLHQAHNTEVAGQQQQFNLGQAQQTAKDVEGVSGTTPEALSLLTGANATKAATAQSQAQTEGLSAENTARASDRSRYPGLPQSTAGAQIVQGQGQLEHGAQALKQAGDIAKGREMVDLATILPYVPQQMQGTISALMQQYGRQPLPQQSDPGMNAALRAHQGTMKMINPDARAQVPYAAATTPAKTSPASAAPQQQQDPVRQMLEQYGITEKTTGASRTGYATPTSSSAPQVQLQGLQQIEAQLSQGKTKGKEGQDRNLKLDEVRAMIRQLQQRVGANR